MAVRIQGSEAKGVAGQRTSLPGSISLRSLTWSFANSTGWGTMRLLVSAAALAALFVLTISGNGAACAQGVAQPACNLRFAGLEKVDGQKVRVLRGDYRPGLGCRAMVDLAFIDGRVMILEAKVIASSKHARVSISKSAIVYRPEKSFDGIDAFLVQFKVRNRFGTGYAPLLVVLDPR